MEINDEVEIIIKGGLLTQDQVELLKQAGCLLAREKQKVRQGEIVDYGFLVFTAAKVYEGFLKTFFYQLGLISRYQFYDTHFRIGKALNPDLPKAFRNRTWLYDDLEAVCGQKAAGQLWEVWRRGRNQIFHYFPDRGDFLSLSEAEAIIKEILEAMLTALSCEAKIKRN
jgi:hypothetical protein